MLPRKLLALKVNTYRWYWVLGKIFWLNHRRNQYILSKTQGCKTKTSFLPEPKTDTYNSTTGKKFLQPTRSECFGKMVRHLGFSLCFPEVALVAKNGLSYSYLYLLLYVWPQFSIGSLDIKIFASLPLRLLTGGSKNKKSHV
jgi:hypothetical protein